MTTLVVLGGICVELLTAAALIHSGMIRFGDKPVVIDNCFIWGSLGLFFSCYLGAYLKAPLFLSVALYVVAMLVAAEGVVLVMLAGRRLISWRHWVLPAPSIFLRFETAQAADIEEWCARCVKGRWAMCEHYGVVIFARRADLAMTRLAFPTARVMRARLFENPEEV